MHLNDEKEVQGSLDGLERERDLLEIPEGKIPTPIYILHPVAEIGYVHWVKLPGGDLHRVVCGGGEDGRGFAPEDCALCKKTLGMYNEAKASEKRKKVKAAKAIRNKANAIRAKFAAEFIAAKGESLVSKVNGKKTITPDFEDAEVGKLSMSEKQYKDFLGLRSNPQYPQIKTGKDLLNRIILLDKQKRDGGLYATIEFRPSKHPSDCPIEEFDPEDFDLESDFEIDEEEIVNVANLLDDDSEEDDSEDDDDLDFEDDFEDDIPGESSDDDLDFEDDEEEEKPKKAAKSSKKKSSKRRK